jgi:hypothetical protein
MKKKLIQTIKKLISTIKRYEKEHTIEGICDMVSEIINNDKTSCENKFEHTFIILFDERYSYKFPDNADDLSHYLQFYSFGVSKSSVKTHQWITEYCDKNNIEHGDVKDIIYYTFKIDCSPEVNYTEMENERLKERAKYVKMWYEPRLKFLEEWLNDLKLEK